MKIKLTQNELRDAIGRYIEHRTFDYGKIIVNLSTDLEDDVEIETNANIPPKTP